MGLASMEACDTAGTKCTLDAINGNLILPMKMRAGKTWMTAREADLLPAQGAGRCEWWRKVRCSGKERFRFAAVLDGRIHIPGWSGADRRVSIDY